MNDAALLVSRIFLALLFLVSGLGMMAAPGGVAGYMGALGVPMPAVSVWIVIVWKVVAALMVIAGFKTRLGALALALFSAAAALLAHLNFADQNEMTQFLKDFAIAGGFIALAVAGPGAYSVDARRG